MTHLLTPRSSASTSHVPASQRLPFWESYNASELIGLKCSTHDPAGLNAWSRTFDLGDIRLTEIGGNQHVVERSPGLVSSQPKDSVFACILLQGEAFLFQSGQCHTVRAGDVYVYSNALPYLYGFTGDMRQIIVEVERSCLAEGGSGMLPAAPIPVDHRLRSGRFIARSLTQTAAGFIARPQAAAAGQVAAHARHLMRASLDPVYARQMGDTAAWRLLRAEAHILEHLPEHGLNAERVAAALGMSARQLHRLFAQSERSVGQWIRDQRLLRAQAELASPASSRLTVGDIADRWAFPSQAHFSRLFKSRFGVTPQAFRRQQLALAREPAPTPN